MLHLEKKKERRKKSIKIWHEFMEGEIITDKHNKEEEWFFKSSKQRRLFLFLSDQTDEFCKEIGIKICSNLSRMC